MSQDIQEFELYDNLEITVNTVLKKNCTVKNCKRLGQENGVCLRHYKARLRAQKNRDKNKIKLVEDEDEKKDREEIEKLAKEEKIILDKDKMKIYNKNYRLNNPEKIKNLSKVYYENNLDKITTYNKGYRNNNKEKLKNYHINYREINYDRLIEKSLIFRQNNRERLNIDAQNYRDKNPEKVKAYFDKIRKENPFLLLLGNCRSYDKIKDRVCNLTIDYLNSLLIDQNIQCYYCNHELLVEVGTKNLAQISVDRIDNNLGHIIGNCVISCLFCNMAKHETKIEYYEDFITVLKYGMTKAIEHKYNDYEESKYLITAALSQSFNYDAKKTEQPIQLLKKDLEEMLKKQNYRCAITGIPFMNLHINKFPFKMSLDRIDSSKLHTLDNCHFVCLGIQYGKNDKSMTEVINHIYEIQNF